jgi:hypothetical protein
MFYSQEQYDEYQRELAGGDGYSNEFQRCYEQSRLNRPIKNERAEAARYHAAGYFVVCATWEVCCPVTDGLIGYDFVIVKACDSLRQAQILTESSESVFLFEPEPPQAPAAPVIDDEIPF